MTDFEKLWDFQNLYRAHRVARLGKRDTKECIEFELDLGKNLTELSETLRDGTYRIGGYYSFPVHDPKERMIHALHYRDRVVQHCLCDEVLAPLLDRRLVYDNSACRLGKGTHFSLDRLAGFMRAHYRRHGTRGYVLRCDIRKFFDSIDHGVLKEKLSGVVGDPDVLRLLFHVIDSYEVTPGKGLPLGNQTSQWFALYYLDGFDRLIKEKLRIRYYTRYMDDCVLLHEDRDYLKRCRTELETYLGTQGLRFNDKTGIFPLRNGVEYLGWHLYLTETGKVVRKVKQSAKRRCGRKLKELCRAYAEGSCSLEEAKQVLNSYRAHLAHGHTYRLRRALWKGVRLRRETVLPAGPGSLRFAKAPMKNESLPT